MESDRLLYNLALQSIVGIGPIRAKKLLAHFGSAKNIFKAKEEDVHKINGLGLAIRDQVKNLDIFKRAEKEMRFLENNGLEAICLEEENYPSRLKHCPDAPIIVFSRGDFKLNKRRVLSVVGTRKMTVNGRNFLQQFMADIKKYDPVIVSGLAYGIDICAHQESLKNDICTIAVLAHGLDRIYPKLHTRTAKQLLDNGGQMSEFWSGTRPERENFVKRNRIIAGLSEATLVVESANKGGSLITADLALSYHREVFAVPGRYADPYSQGCNMLIQTNQAAMISSAEDLAQFLGWTPTITENKSLRQNKLIGLQDDEKKLYHYLLLADKVQLDRLSLQASLSIQKTVTILLKLELKGMVRSYPGKRYQAI